MNKEEIDPDQDIREKVENQRELTLRAQDMKDGAKELYDEFYGRFLKRKI